MAFIVSVDHSAGESVDCGPPTFAKSSKSVSRSLSRRIRRPRHRGPCHPCADVSVDHSAGESVDDKLVEFCLANGVCQSITQPANPSTASHSFLASSTFLCQSITQPANPSTSLTEKLKVVIEVSVDHSAGESVDYIWTGTEYILESVSRSLSRRIRRPLGLQSLLPHGLTGRHASMNRLESPLGLQSQGTHDTNPDKQSSCNAASISGTPRHHLYARSPISDEIAARRKRRPGCQTARPSNDD